MRCLICKSGTMTESTSTYFAHLKNGYVLIENVPCQTCNQCGETVYSALVMERIDEILASVERFSSKIIVMDYSAAA